MPVNCPKCGKATTRHHLKVTDVAGGPSTGLLYFLFFPFFSRQFCPEHGRLARADFPPAESRRLLLYPIGWALLMIAALLLLGWLAAISI